jgi:hypothetical protein
MATGAANMRTLTRQLKKVPDESVTELVRWMVPRSEQLGGRMLWFGKNRKLTIKIKKRWKKQASNIAIVAGVPVSCWSIKSYGRKGGYDVRPKTKQALSLRGYAPGVYFAHSVHVQSGTAGDRRWDRLIAEARVRFPDIVGDLVERKVAA